MRIKLRLCSYKLHVGIRNGPVAKYAKLWQATGLLSTINRKNITSAGIIICVVLELLLEVLTISICASLCTTA